MMHFLSSIGAFAGNLIAALLLISAFVFIYVRTTPYVEREQIANGNAAVAIALGGALIGYAVVLARAISFSEWIGEMVLWGLVGLCVQVAGHFILALDVARVEDARHEVAEPDASVLLAEDPGRQHVVSRTQSVDPVH